LFLLACSGKVRAIGGHQIDRSFHQLNHRITGMWHADC
jgi:hypothetical protein